MQNNSTGTVATSVPVAVVPNAPRNLPLRNLVLSNDVLHFVNEPFAVCVIWHRPWLQDFTLTWVPKDQIVEYGPNEVRAQIKAAEDFGQAGGWMLYDSANQYTVEALKPK